MLIIFNEIYGCFGRRGINLETFANMNLMSFLLSIMQRSIGKGWMFVNYYLTGIIKIIYVFTIAFWFLTRPTLKDCGDVAQLGERGVRNAEVRGSIPLISTRDKKTGCF